MKRFCDLASPIPIDVLDIGGGQLALLCKKLWNDRACVADLNRRHKRYSYLLNSKSVSFTERGLYRSGLAYSGLFPHAGRREFGTCD